MGKEAREGRLYVATETFAIDGHRTITKNVTRVREGHPLLTQYPQFFRVADAHYEWDVEQATAGPGEGRGVKV